MNEEDKNSGFDRMLTEALKEELKNTPPPMLSASEAWEKLSNKQNKDKKRYQSKDHIIFRRKWFYTACAAILFLTILFTSPQGSVAYSKITEIFQTINDNVVGLFIKVSDDEGDRTDQPNSDESLMIDDIETEKPDYKHMSFEEAQKNTTFDIKEPTFIPDDIESVDITVVQFENEINEMVTIHYEGAYRSFTIEQGLIGDSFSMGNVFHQEEVEIETIDINGHKASMVKLKHGYTKLIWTTQSHYYSIDGELTEEEVIEIAESI